MRTIYKLIIFAIIMLAFGGLRAQTIIGAGNSSTINYQKGGTGADSMVKIPYRDTTALYPGYTKCGRITIRPQDGQLYVHDCLRWVLVGSGGVPDSFASKRYVDSIVATIVAGTIDSNLYATVSRLGDSMLYTGKAIRAWYFGLDNTALDQAKALAGDYGVIDGGGYTYTMNDGFVLGKGQKLINAKVFRAAEVATTINSNYTIGDGFFTVASVPAGWAVGNTIQIYSSDAGASTGPARQITNISNDTVYINATYANDYSTGAGVRKIYNLFTYPGYYDTTDQGALVPVYAEMERVFIDGNKENNAGNLSWQFNSTLSGGFVKLRNCSFVDIPNENIIGDGFYIEDCEANNLNGSFVHWSASKSFYDLTNFSNIVRGNRVSNTNLEAAKNEHGDAAIEHSFSALNMIISGNYFYNVQFAIDNFQASSPADAGFLPPRGIVYSNNIVRKCRGAFMTSPEFILDGSSIARKGGFASFTGNTIDSAGIGTANDWTPFAAMMDSLFDNITWVGNSLNYTDFIFPQNRVFFSDANGSIINKNNQDFYILKNGFQDTILKVNADNKWNIGGDYFVSGNGLGGLINARMTTPGTTHTLYLIGDRLSNRVSNVVVDSLKTFQYYREIFGKNTSTSKGYQYRQLDSIYEVNNSGTLMFGRNNLGEFTTAKNNTRYNWKNPADLGSPDFNSLTTPGMWGGYIAGSGVALNNPAISEYYFGQTFSGADGLYLTQWLTPMPINTQLPTAPLFRARANGSWGPWGSILSNGNVLLTPNTTVTNGNLSAGRKNSIIYCVTSSSNDTITLTGTSSGVWAGAIWWIKKQSSANNVVIKPSSGTINGNAIYSFADTTCPVIVQYDGTNYKIVQYDCGSFLKRIDTATNSIQTATEVAAQIAAAIAAKADTGLIIKNGTVTGSSSKIIVLTRKNGDTLQIPFTDMSGGGGIDTTSLSNRINERIKYIDTATFSVTLTTGDGRYLKIASFNASLDTIASKRQIDSVAALIVSGTPTLDQVLLSGNTTTNDSAQFGSPYSARSSGSRISKHHVETPIVEAGNINTYGLTIAKSSDPTNKMIFDPSGIVSGTTVTIAPQQWQTSFTMANVEDTATDHYMASKWWSLSQFYKQVQIDALLDDKVNLSDSNTLWTTFFQLKDTSKNIRDWAESKFLTSFTELDPDYNAEKADYELVANKNTNTSLGTSDVDYPSQKAVKTYVDNAVGSIVSGTSIDAGIRTTVRGTGALIDPYLIDVDTVTMETKYTGDTSRANIYVQFGLKQPLNTHLTSISGLTPSNDDVLQYKSGAWVNRSISQLKSDLNLSGTNTGDQTTITGNAGTATALQTARNINGVAFDGTANITVTAAAGTLTGTTLNSSVVTSSLTSVGTLTALAMGTGNITSTGSISSTGSRLTKLWATDIESTNAPTVGGTALPTATSTTTLTNKRITPRITTIASSATPTPDADASDMFTVTALAAGATFAAPTGTPTDGQQLLIRIKDNGTARALGWNAAYRGGTDIALPTTTVLSKTMYIQFVYNFADTIWDLVGLTDGL